MTKHQEYFRKLAEACRKYKITIDDGNAAALADFLSEWQPVKEPPARLANSTDLAAYLQKAVDAVNAGEIFDLNKALQEQNLFDPHDPVVRRTARKLLKDDPRLEYAKPVQARFVRRLNGNGRNGNSKRSA